MDWCLGRASNRRSEGIQVKRAELENSFYLQGHKALRKTLEKLYPHLKTTRVGFWSNILGDWEDGDWGRFRRVA
jgi:hypothetical protein